MTFTRNLEEDRILGESVIKSVEHWDDDVVNDQAMAGTMEFFKRQRSIKIAFILVCLILIFVVFGIAITIGAYNIGFTEVYQIIWYHLTDQITEDLAQKEYIVINYRMPRVIAGIFCGAGLAVCGAVMQSVLKNPLADPYTTGVSSGASMGATLAMSFGASTSGSSPEVILSAFIFALIPTGMMIAISKMKNASPTTMIMAGLGIMYIFNAVTTVLMLWADPQDLSRIYRWQVGSLESINWNSIPYIVVVTVIGIIAVTLLSNKLNVLATGDESAKALGVDADRLRVVCLVLVGVIAAVVVSFTGLIGFVGLVTPHIVRLFIGSDNRYLIIASAFFGAVLLLVADIIGRSVMSSNLQVGVVMAFIGGPVFLWLLVSSKKSMWG